MITIITSLFKGQEYIEFYLKNITKCLDYKLCEHLIFNIANSNDNNVNNLLSNYAKKYVNIKIIELYEDPGIYNIWNLAIKMAQHKYLLSSNIDDTISIKFLKLAYDYLENNKNINLVCFPVKVSYIKNTDNFDDGDVWFKEKKINYFKYTIKKNNKLIDIYPKYKIYKKIKNKKKHFFDKPEKYCYYNYFDKYDMLYIENNTIRSHNIPHCCPVWRKSLHYKYGFFNEKEYGPYADYEFWLRCMNDSTLYGFIPTTNVIYYINKNSHNRRYENSYLLKKIFKQYYNIPNIDNFKIDI